MGQQIRKVRIANDLSQGRFAKRVGISPQSISAYETGKVKPPLKVLEKISAEYSITFSLPNLETKEDILKTIKKVSAQLEQLKDTLENSTGIYI